MEKRGDKKVLRQNGIHIELVGELGRCPRCKELFPKDMFLTKKSNLRPGCPDCVRSRAEDSKAGAKKGMHYKEEDGESYCKGLADNVKGEGNYDHYPNNWNTTYFISL